MTKPITDLEGRLDAAFKRSEKALGLDVGFDIGIHEGDILEHSGGYNCTQTQFVIVEGFNRTGKKAILRGIAKVQYSGDWMNGNVTADPQVRSKETFEAKVVNDSSYKPYCRGRKSYGNGQAGPIQNYYLWSGKPIWNNCD